MPTRVLPSRSGMHEKTAKPAPRNEVINGAGQFMQYIAHIAASWRQRIADHSTVRRMRYRHGSVFKREQRALLHGLSMYADNAIDSRRYRLRRNIHRIEKGLTMRPLRRSFALSYIDETVETYVTLSSNDGAPAELQWAHDVLSDYFSTVEVTNRLSTLKERFDGANRHADITTYEGHSIFRRDLTVPSPVAYQDLFDLAQRRRSVRFFEQRSVQRRLIDKAMQVATLAPSACNRQPFHFRVFDDPDRVSAIASIAMGTKGYAENIPVFIVIVGEQSAFFDERDRHVIYTDASLSAMSLVLALETLGLSSCCINWPDIEDRERRMARELSLSPDQRPVMCVAVGHPDVQALVAYSKKKSLADIRRYN